MSDLMHCDISRKLIEEWEIKDKICGLCFQISNDYRNKELVLIATLKGSFIFAADLCRCLSIPHKIDFIGAQSYGSSTVSSGQVTITKDIETSLKGKHVLILEDIYDTGRTLSVLIDFLKIKQPESIEICSLLVKKKNHDQNVDVKYVGFEIADEFVVGYGLDYNQYYRHLPYIGVLSPSAIV